MVRYASTERVHSKKRIATTSRRIFGIRRAIEWIRVPSLAKAERRARSGPTLLSSLTAEQLAMIKAYDGPEIIGRGGPKRKFDELSE